MPLSGKQLVRLLQQRGWQHVRTRGSHFILIKDKASLVVPVHGNKSLGKGLERKLLKDAGVKK